MENTNTDARKAAEEIAKKEIETADLGDYDLQSLRENFAYAFIKGYEFAQYRPATLDDLGIDTAADAWVKKHVVFAKWKDAFKAGYALRESLSEQRNQKQ